MGGFKLGGMTLGSLFKQPETIQYPQMEKRPSPIARGVVECVVEECVFCGVCARCCPADAIEVDRQESTWTVDRFRCVKCASCVSRCPQKCLSMEAARPAVATRKSKLVLTAE